jgi:hypothetical protein
MSTTLFVWLPSSGNIGHASIQVATTYMSWWPGSDKMLSYLVTGGSPQTPTYDSDVDSEGGEPDWTGDFFGWDDDGAIAFWNAATSLDFQKAVSAVRSGIPPQQYSFVCNNCSTMVIKILRAAGAFDGEFVLNLWLSSKIVNTPEQVMDIGGYLAGDKGALLNNISIF